MGEVPLSRARREKRTLDCEQLLSGLEYKQEVMTGFRPWPFSVEIL